MTQDQINRLNDYRSKLHEKLDLTTSKRKTKRKTWNTVIVTSTHFTPDQLTDTATAYIMDKARRYTLTAIKTVHQKEATPFLNQLITESYRSFVRQNRSDMVEEITGDDGYTTQVKHIHRKKCDNGIQVPIIPYETLDNTKKGSEFLSIGSIDTSDFDNLVSVAILAIMELINDGVIQDFSGLDQNRRLVYRAINRALHAERKSSASNELFSDLCIMYENLENTEEAIETILYGRDIDRRLSDVSRVDLFLTLEKIIQDHFNKRFKDKKLIEDSIARYNKVLHMLYQGYTIRQISEDFSINIFAVERYINTMRKIFMLPENFQVLSSLIG